MTSLLSRHDFHRVLQDLEALDRGLTLDGGIPASAVTRFASTTLHALLETEHARAVMYYGLAKSWQGWLERDIPVKDKRDFIVNLGAMLDSFFREDCEARLQPTRKVKESRT